MPLHCLLVDDEPLARAGLRMLLEQAATDATIREATNGAEAIARLRDERFDLVFLDVQMPEVDGFGVLNAIGAEHMPPVVFVTAHDEHAITAFELNAVDYLLKPVTRERFERSLERVRGRLAGAQAQQERQQLAQVLEALQEPRRALTRLAVKSPGRTTFVEVAEIDWIGAAENYVELHVSADMHLLRVTLARLEQALDPARFVRIHRSTIVAIDRIASLVPGVHGEYVVNLRDGTQLESGRSYSDRIRAIADNPF